MLIYGAIMRKFAGFCLLAMLGIIQAASQPVITPPSFIPPTGGGSAPTISSICTTQGPTTGGDTVVITGTNLTNVSNVAFGGTSVGTQWFYNNPNGTGITAISPAGSAGVVDIRVTSSGGTSAIVAADQFTYVTPSSLPTVTSVAQNNDSVNGGDETWLLGTNFSGVTAVKFGTSNGTSIGVQSTVGLTVNTPAHAAGPVNVTVTTSAGTSVPTCANQFTFTAGSGTPPSVPAIPATATRPSYNTGTGYFVVGRGIYDPNGNLFIPMGANAQHYDGNANNKYASGINIERLEVYFSMGVCGSPSTFNSICLKQFVDKSLTNHVVPMIMNYYCDWTNFTFRTTDPACQTNALLQQTVGYFTGTSGCATGVMPCATSWTSNYNSSGWINIANEWGACSQNDTGSLANSWLPAYITAVQSMRAAGFTMPLVIDAGCHAQDPGHPQTLGTALQAADPLHNIIISIHIYESFYYIQANQANPATCRSTGSGGHFCQFHIQPDIATWAQTTVPVIMGEFGCQSTATPGDNCPGSYIDFSAQNLIDAAAPYQMGWLLWSIDEANCDWTPLGSNTNPSPQTCVASSTGTCYKDQAGTNVTTLYGAQVFDSPNGTQAKAARSTSFVGSPPTPPACPF